MLAYHFDRYDLVDLTRQVLSKLANKVFLDAMVAFQKRDVKSFSLYTQNFLQLIKDIDVLLASDDNFLLGTWLESAKKLALNPSEMRKVGKFLSLFFFLTSLLPGKYFFMLIINIFIQCSLFYIVVPASLDALFFSSTLFIW